MNEPNKSNTISRSELARIIGMSEDTIRRREEEWGLTPCRSKASKSTVLYFRSQASEALLTRYIIYRAL